MPTLNLEFRLLILLLKFMRDIILALERSYTLNKNCMKLKLLEILINLLLILSHQLMKYKKILLITMMNTRHSLLSLRKSQKMEHRNYIRHSKIMRKQQKINEEPTSSFLKLHKWTRTSTMVEPPNNKSRKQLILTFSDKAYYYI